MRYFAFVLVVFSIASTAEKLDDEILNNRLSKYVKNLLLEGQDKSDQDDIRTEKPLDEKQELLDILRNLKNKNKLAKTEEITTDRVYIIKNPEALEYYQYKIQKYKNKAKQDDVNNKIYFKHNRLNGKAKGGAHQNLGKQKISNPYGSEENIFKLNLNYDNQHEKSQKRREYLDQYYNEGIRVKSLDTDPRERIYYIENPEVMNEFTKELNNKRNDLENAINNLANDVDEEDKQCTRERSYYIENPEEIKRFRDGRKYLGTSQELPGIFNSFNAFTDVAIHFDPQRNSKETLIAYKRMLEQENGVKYGSEYQKKQKTVKKQLPADKKYDEKNLIKVQSDSFKNTDALKRKNIVRNSNKNDSKDTKKTKSKTTKDERAEDDTQWDQTTKDSWGDNNEKRDKTETTKRKVDEMVDSWETTKRKADKTQAKVTKDSWDQNNMKRDKTTKKKTTKDSWGKTTRDPWGKTTKDSWDDDKWDRTKKDKYGDYDYGGKTKKTTKYKWDKTTKDTWRDNDDKWDKKKKDTWRDNDDKWDRTTKKRRAKTTDEWDNRWDRKETTRRRWENKPVERQQEPKYQPAHRPSYSRDSNERPSRNSRNKKGPSKYEYNAHITPIPLIGPPRLYDDKR